MFKTCQLLGLLVELACVSQNCAVGQLPSAPQCSIEGAGSHVKNVKVDRYGDENSPHVVMFLHGSGGPESHEDWIKGLTSQGLLVLVPHFFDAAAGKDPTDKNYADWAQAVAYVMTAEKARLHPDAELNLMGYSLGASVALVLATQCPIAQRVVSWEGSLPDFFYMHLRTMPHLLILHGEDDAVVPFVNASQLATLCGRLGVPCELKGFKGEGHIFSSAKVQEAEADARRFLQSK